MNISFHNKVVLVTGASRGIGQAFAEAFAANGAKVVINYVHNKEFADSIVQNIQKNGGQALSVQADVSKLSELEALFHTTIEQFGQLDILVNNAGIMTTRPLEQITEHDFDQHMAINVKGTYFGCQLASKLMKPGGRIINLSTSILGQMAPTYSLYAGTKGAVEQFTRHLSKELAPKGITINAIAPGPTNTELFVADKTEAQIDTFKRMIGFNRLGEVEDIVKVVLFMASNESGWISGQTIRVNGAFI